jgi:hypothetical protein
MATWFTPLQNWHIYRISDGFAKPWCSDKYINVPAFTFSHAALCQRKPRVLPFALRIILIHFLKHRLTGICNGDATFSSKVTERNFEIFIDWAFLLKSLTYFYAGICSRQLFTSYFRFKYQIQFVVAESRLKFQQMQNRTAFNGSSKYQTHIWFAA